MTTLVDLGNTFGCPVGDRCDVCGATGQLTVATAVTSVGVHCVTVCVVDEAAGKVPRPASWAQVVKLAGEHCRHLGIDVDAMAAAMEREGGRG